MTGLSQEQKAMIDAYLKRETESGDQIRKRRAEEAEALNAFPGVGRWARVGNRIITWPSKSDTSEAKV